MNEQKEKEWLGFLLGISIAFRNGLRKELILPMRRNIPQSSLSLSFLLLLTVPAVVQAQFTFTTNNGTITITGYTGSGGAVVIPNSTNGYPVTSIGEDAFGGCTSLTSVTIPDSVTSIGVQAFWICRRLSAIMVDALNPFTGLLHHDLMRAGRFMRCWRRIALIAARAPSITGGW